VQKGQDDTEEEEMIARLIEEIGFAAADAGFLHERDCQQPGQLFTTKS
jgi:predicted dinucleotide-binding enzyme